VTARSPDRSGISNSQLKGYGQSFWLREQISGQKRLNECDELYSQTPSRLGESNPADQKQKEKLMYFLNNKKAFLGLVGLLLVVSFLAYTGNTNTVVAEG